MSQTWLFGIEYWWSYKPLHTEEPSRPTVPRQYQFLKVQDDKDKWKRFQIDLIFITTINFKGFKLYELIIMAHIGSSYSVLCILKTNKKSEPKVKQKRGNHRRKPVLSLFQHKLGINNNDTSK